MGLSNTFECLQSFSEGEQLDLCVAALNEAHAELQKVAMQELADPNRLNRPDLVVDSFGSLLPGAVENAKQWSGRLLEIASTRIGEGAGPGRLAAFRAVAALSDGAGVETLVSGTGDSMLEVRDIAFAGIEQRVRWLVSARREANDGGDPDLLRDRAAELIWAALERCVRSFPQHQRASFLDVLPDFGIRPLALIVGVLKGNRCQEYVDPMTESLMRSRAPECIELVLALAGHKSAAVSMVGRRVLQKRGDEAFQVALAERMVGLAEDSLIALRDEAWGHALFEAVPQLDKEIAVSLLEPAMGQAPSKAEGQVRVEAFLEHPAADVQVAAVEALRELGCPNGFDSVGRLLLSGPDEVRLAAARLVIELGAPNRAALLTPLLGSKDPEARRIAMREVAEFSLPRFLDKFDGMDQHAREVAARALAKIDDNLIERISDEFGGFDSGQRIKALKIVELLDAGAELRDTLLEMLDDFDVRVRATAIRIVHMAGSVEGIKVLIDALSDSDRRVRANAIEAFEQIDTPQCVDLLVPFLRDRDNRVRANAAKALWNLGWPDARDVLIKMTKDEDPSMRLSALWAIQELRFHGAREVLVTCEMTERDPEIRTRIKEALDVLGSAPEEAR